MQPLVQIDNFAVSARLGSLATNAKMRYKVQVFQCILKYIYDSKEISV